MKIFAAIALAVALLGCGKKKEAPKKNISPEDRKLLTFLPTESQIVIGLDAAALRESPLVQRGVRKLFEKDRGLADEFKSIREQCKFSIGEDLSYLLVGLKDERTILVARAEGVFNQGALTACIQARVSSDGGTLTAKRFGNKWGYQLLPKANEKPIYFVLASEAVMLVSTAEAWLAPRDTNGPSLEALGKTDFGATVWAAGIVPEAVGKGLIEATGSSVSAPPQTIYGHLDLGDGLLAGLFIGMGSEADAEALTTMASSQMGALAAVAQKVKLAPVIRRVKVTRENQEVAFTVELSEKELADITANVDSGSTKGQDFPPQREGRTKDGNAKDNKRVTPANR